MRLSFFDTHKFEREVFTRANAAGAHTIQFHEPRLTIDTAPLVEGSEAVCAFVNDRLDARCLGAIHERGVKIVALRCAGYNQVDLDAAAALGMKVVRVPEYSPYAVAEHAVALALAVIRKLPRAHARVREWNFSLEGLVGFDLHGRTVGVIGTGRIGQVAARIFGGFGCRVLAFDLHPNDALVAAGVEYVGLDRLYAESDVITLHVPLTPKTHHLIDGAALGAMKQGVVIVNTGRGALIDSRALIGALKSGQVGAAGLDVYEEEEGVFFEDLSDRVLQDDVLARLITFPNVLVTAHQAFLTREALDAIAGTTLGSLSDFEAGRELVNEVRAEAVLRRKG